MYQTLLKPLFADVKTFVLDTLFPKTCAACGKEGAFLCLYCTSTLKQVEFQQCIICRKPSPYGLTHQVCKTPHAPEGLISFFDYHDKKVSDCIIQGKYSFMLEEIYKIFGKLVAARLASKYPQFGLNTAVGEDLIFPPIGGRIRSAPTPLSAFSLVPIPLSPSRKRWRGFNQAEVLCNTIGKELNMPVINALQRIKSTKTQKDLKREARIENVRDVFAVHPLFFKDPSRPARAEAEGVGRSSIKEKNLILVDDVTTTGSTLLEAAKVLKRQGAAEVWCLTVARD